MSRIPPDPHATHPVIAVWRRISALPRRSLVTLALASVASLVVLAVGVLAGIFSR